MIDKRKKQLIEFYETQPSTVLKPDSIKNLSVKNGHEQMDRKKIRI